MGLATTPLHPCDVCGERSLTYPGTCQECAANRHTTYETEWQASYKAATRKHENDPWGNMRNYLPDEAPGRLGAILGPFPKPLHLETMCGGERTRFKIHAMHSATDRQDSYLKGLAKRSGYNPPPGTCCSHHASILISELQSSQQQTRRTAP